MLPKNVWTRDNVPRIATSLPLKAESGVSLPTGAVAENKQNYCCYFSRSPKHSTIFF